MVSAAKKYTRSDCRDNTEKLCGLISIGRQALTIQNQLEVAINVVFFSVHSMKKMLFNFVFIRVDVFCCL